MVRISQKKESHCRTKILASEEKNPKEQDCGVAARDLNRKALIRSFEITAEFTNLPVPVEQVSQSL